MTSVGIDMIEIQRIREALERYEGFRDRCFTAVEQAYCEKRGPGRHQSYAARPKPSVRLSGRIEAWSRRLGAGPIDLSMSHSRELASAVCVVADPDV